MERTLMILVTFNVDEAVISEYRKLKNTPNVDTILAIDNNVCKFDFKDRIENRIFFDTSVKCFFFDSKLHDEMQLPYYTFNGNTQFASVMWHNCDYRFYYVRRFFPNYDYYWQVEYDVFCNAKTYEGFLSKFVHNLSDLIVKDFRSEVKHGEWHWAHSLDWIYNDVEIYGSLYSIVRLSARAIDFLYRRRLEHKEIFQNSNENDKRWIFCELFTPTELMNAGFTCENLDEKYIRLSTYYLNDDRFFLNPDNKLYHPIKSTRKKISEMQDRYNALFFLFRKNFLNQLIEKLAQTFISKKLIINVNEQFNYIAVSFDRRQRETGGGYRLEFTLRNAFYSGKNFRYDCL